VRSLPVRNPTSRFETVSLDYDEGEAPNAELEVLEDHTRSILATNDSPDVGFRWSVNPYRGCQHACSYCVSGETLVLMGDGRTRKLRDIRVGDCIYGTRVDGAYRRYVRTKVLAHWATFKRAYRIVLGDGTELFASGDHRFLTLRGWKHVTGREQGAARRPHLTVGSKMMGLGSFVPTPPGTAEYRRGYLCGLIRGDGMRFRGTYRRKGGGECRVNLFRLALVDLDALRRARLYLDEVQVHCRGPRLFQAATATTRRVLALHTSTRTALEAIEEIIAWPPHRTQEWARGFLAGIFDAEGSFSRGILRISNTDARLLEETLASLSFFGFDATLEKPAREGGASNVRVRGGLKETIRFLHLTDPAIRRKWDLEGVAIKSNARLEVARVEDLGFSMQMFDITTETEDFFANGVVSHNCFARPSHEYLSLGAGTDFERKIVIKPRAPELLRAAFEKKSWKGERVIFSGVTDCYQPLEAKLRLTRGCLEVCAEYKNPVGIITKSPIIERDIDVLQELAEHASVRISVSIPFWDREIAKAMEPVVTTPARRMAIVERLAKAGIPVGVSVAPIVPGLSDQEVPRILAAAANAGATHAFYVLLRLPGAVKEVFERALRDKLPLRADKVLRRLREMHGGKLYDPAYGRRQTGEGIYAEAVAALFANAAKRYGLDAEMDRGEAPETFRRPDPSGQTSFGF
jgi:DNA repair photolyase